MIAGQGNTTDTVAGTVDDFVFLAISCCDGYGEVAKSWGAPIYAQVFHAAAHDCCVETVALEDDEHEEEDERRQGYEGVMKGVGVWVL